MDERLVEAYRSTRYAVLDGDGSTLAEARIGQASPGIDALLGAHHATSGTFITAWNPRSEPTRAEVNESAHTRLVAELAAVGAVVLAHAGVGADPSWTERGLFVVGLREVDAIELATSYAQNAIVVVELGRPARLVPTPLMT